MDVFRRSFFAVVNEVNKPKSFVSGGDFENFCDDLFDKKYFELVHRTSDYTQNSRRFATGDKDFDFEYKDKLMNRNFAIECKYRTNTDVVELCTPQKFEHYKRVASNIPFFFLLGCGNKANNPQILFLIPISKIKLSKFYPQNPFSEKFFLPVNFVSSNHLWL